MPSGYGVVVVAAAEGVAAEPQGVSSACVAIASHTHRPRIAATAEHNGFRRNAPDFTALQGSDAIGRPEGALLIAIAQLNRER